MTVGLGTGSTVAYLLPALAARSLDIRCVATSPRTEEAARGLGLRIEPFVDIDRFDLAIDGADQISPDGWLVKGGGGAHTREKIVAAAADCFVVIADSSKPVRRCTRPSPSSCWSSGCGRRCATWARSRLRDVPRSPDGGVIADYIGRVDDPRPLAARLADDAGRGRARTVPARDGHHGAHRARRGGRTDRRRSPLRCEMTRIFRRAAQSAAWSARTSDAAASTRPAGMEVSPAKSCEAAPSCPRR